MANVKGEGSIKISELQSQKKQLDGILAAATSALSFTAGISLAVASVSVMTAMLVSVGERKREIGIKKSLGARNIRIVGEFLAESTMICIIGSIVGIAAGCAAAGCGTGFLAEKYLPWDVLLRRALFLFLTAAVCFSWEIPVFPLAFLGGVGLYHASAGILPEPVSIRNALFSAGGFLAGVFLFSPLL